MFYQEHSLK